MKKLLTLLFVAVVCFQAYSLSLMPNRFSGSVLCENLSLKRSLPDSLQERYYYSYTVTVSDTSTDLYVDYFLEKGDGKADTLKELYADLNKHFSTISLERIQQIWNVHEKYYLEGDRIMPTTFYYNSGYPGRVCYSTKEEKCNEVKVYRKSIRQICGNTIYHTKGAHTIENDSVYISYKDSIETVEVTCKAIGSFIHTDSLTITGLENKKYDFFRSDTIQLVCVTTPCLPHYYTEYLATYDFTDCVISSFNEGITEKTKEFYPNPATDILTIPDYFGEIELINQMGRVFTIKGDKTFLVSELPEGVYVISTAGENRRRLGKILIQ